MIGEIISHYRILESWVAGEWAWSTRRKISALDHREFPQEISPVN